MCVSTQQEVSKAQAASRARLDAEYRRLVDNLVEAQQLRGGEEWLSNPTLPEDVVRESMPGGATQYTESQEAAWTKQLAKGFELVLR